MPDETGLVEILHALIYHKEFRDEFIASGPESASLPLTPAQRTALTAVDLDELSRTTSRIQSMILRGHVDRHGGLRASFPKTLALLAGQGLKDADLCARFLASPYFDRFREIPYGDKGLSLEECFYEFLCAGPCDIGADARFLATHELFKALISHVRAGSLATFDIRTELFRSNGSAWFGILEHDAAVCRALAVEPACDGTVLYAIGGMGLVIGQVPGWMGRVLLLPEISSQALEDVASDEGLESSLLHDAALRLMKLGLLPAKGQAVAPGGGAPAP
ncbi:hypothetical protein FXF51_27470 [Nonomuraea sp. PA05]|uniref:hypothetical protein n=1 Tax=Nonomuraea sp. PA05 TaxID=2604466 RepID=UPI0011D89831|nr:hypothetical protein [Nonomuraea sp. PA05]TYB61815.1 hypothetical protein FXF51_27470 [Nonomuraea sp. PA05]